MEKGRVGLQPTVTIPTPIAAQRLPDTVVKDVDGGALSSHAIPHRALSVCGPRDSAYSPPFGPEAQSLMASVRVATVEWAHPDGPDDAPARRVARVQDHRPRRGRRGGDGEQNGREEGGLNGEPSSDARQLSKSAPDLQAKGVGHAPCRGP